MTKSKSQVHSLKENKLTENQVKILKIMDNPIYWRGPSGLEVSRLLNYKNREPVARWINQLKYKGYLNSKNIPIISLLNECLKKIQSDLPIASQINGLIIHTPDCAYNTHKSNPHFYCTKGCGRKVVKYVESLLESSPTHQKSEIIKDIKGMKKWSAITTAPYIGRMQTPDDKIYNQALDDVIEQLK